MNRLHRLAGVGRQEGEQVAGLHAGLDLADAGPILDVDAGKEGQRFGIVDGQLEPDRTVVALGVPARLAEGRERDQASVLRLQPGLPVRGRGVADVGRAAVGLHLQQLGEVDGLALGPQLVGPLGGRVHQRLARRRHAPARRGQDALPALPADDWCGVVGVDVARLHVADVRAHGARQVQDRLGAAALSVQVAHGRTLSRQTGFVESVGCCTARLVRQLRQASGPSSIAPVHSQPLRDCGYS
ncbi:hypothetical protein D3C87_1503190 [compost metagenome]